MTPARSIMPSSPPDERRINSLIELSGGTNCVDGRSNEGPYGGALVIS
jgi:hypothetical protein